MRKPLLIVICFLAFSVPALAHQSALPFVPSACPFPIPGGELEGETIDCGLLTVPEDHQNPGGREIQLAVARIHSTSPSPKPDPVLYLAGGPGAGALAEVNFWRAYPIRQERDIILLDQRGTGYSQPLLNCPNITASNSTYDSVEVCRARLVREGINLSDYNSAQSAADIADLRLALGYDAWNLLGISYGTRLALAVMRDHPEGVRSAILDSVYPPQVNELEEHATNEVNAFNLLFNGCLADVACNRAYPVLEIGFYQTVARLNQQPATYTSAEGSVTLSGDNLAQDLFQALYVTRDLPYLPQALYDASQGDYRLLDSLNTGTVFNRSRVSATGHDIQSGGGADGMYNSVTCSEEIPFNNYDKAAANAQAAPPELRAGLLSVVRSMFNTCAIWGVTPAAPIESLPVTSALPSLVLAGEYDPATPVAWSASAAKTLSKSFLFEFPGTAHGTIDNGICPTRIILDFLDDPTQQPKSSCIAGMTEPQFVTSPP